jgi:hypothetical protein
MATGKQASINRRAKAKQSSSSSINPKPLMSGVSTGPGGSARGDDFADAAIDSGRVGEFKQIEVPTKPRTKKQLQGATFSTSGGSSPTVLTNANKIERVVPLLNSKVSNLSANNLSSGGANFSNAGDTTADSGSDNTDSSFDELLGFTENKKKKKKKEGEVIYSPMEQQQLALLEQMQQTQDKRLRQSITNTQRTFDERARQQQDATAQGINTIKQVLNLGGSSRYAPVSSQGIVSAAEAAGIKALAELDATEQKTIAEIQEARDNLDYQTLEKKFNFLDGIRKEKAAATTALEETVKEQETKSSRDNALAGLVSQGITNPIEMLNMLNFDEQGNKIGDFTLGEITGSLKSLKELAGTGDGIGDTGFKLDNKAIGQLLGSGWTAPDIKDMQADLAAGASIDDILAGVDPDMQDAVKKAFGIDEVKDTNVRPGKGAKTPLDEALIRTRLFSKIAPILNKGALSDSDRAIIDGRIAQFRDAGMGEQEILDTLAGIPPEVASPYNNKFRDLIVSNSDTMEKQNSNIGRLSQQLASGNYTAAMNTVETLSLNEAKKIDPDGFIGTATTQNYLKKGKELSELLVGAEDIIGPLDGTWEQVKGKLLKSKDNRAATISAKIAGLVAQMRNDLSGTAVTSSEAAFLEPLIPSLSDTMANFGSKVKALNENTLGQYNTVRSSVSLPEVTAEQVIDPKKRLILYSNDIYLPANGQLDI